MAQFGWINCPADVRRQVDEFVCIQREVLGASLVGVYLHGSLACGCFNPRCSDVDLLVVVEGELGAKTMAGLARQLIDLYDRPRPLECSHLSRGDLSPWKHPTPFQFHFGDNWVETYRTELASGAWQEWPVHQRIDGDLAGHVTMLNERGVTLLGAPIQDVFPVVPRPHYEASILDDADWLMDLVDDDPLYAILNLCRVWAWLRDGLVTSKEEGGTWAAAQLAGSHRSVVEAGLRAYRGDGQIQLPERAAYQEFVAYARREIGSLRS